MKLKKPKFWDLKKPNFFAYLLFPFTLLIQLNNQLLKIAYKKKFKEIKTICIGNIYLGGTGKTPTVLKLYELLKNSNLKIVTAKKFYINQKDEQLILEKQTEFISLKTRQEIIERAIEQKFDLIIFDDGLQEKTVNYDLKFVCFDIQNWIGNGCLIPSGPLREKVESLKKYDGVFLKSINKDPKSNKISSILKQINPNIKIFNSIVYIKNFEKFDISKKYLIFSGLGNLNSFKDILIENNFNIIEEINFPDHHNYKTNDIQKILDKAKKIDANIITTEKDFVKIPDQLKSEINCIEIDLNILEADELIKFIKSKIYETN